MSNKNPFEIRLELLKMAREYLDQQWNVNVNLAHEVLSKAMQNGEDVAKMWNKFIPEIYSIDDITKKANELYKFVCDGSQSK
ncbi:MAG: hypothetical protein EBU90_21735 [Proteobacteria bacterium]|nr:hypothetical protein [Pseudomonadota bacterium]